MSNKIYFTPGPTQMYPGMSRFLQDAMQDDVASISHRSDAFRNIYKKAADGLAQLLNLPENYHVLFLGSASEAWERILLNTVEKKSFHFVNGSFSKKFHQYAIGLGKDAAKVTAPFGEGFDPASCAIDQNNELIAVTQNETSSGVAFPLDDIYALKKRFPEQLMAVDMVSCLPVPAMDFTQIDTAFFSVQKCFGMPAGLGVWLVNDKCVEKSNALAEKGVLTGPHNNLTELVKKAKDYQTPATPNVLGIYLLGRVCEDMLKRGIDTIREESKEKFKLLYQLIEDSSFLEPAVKEKTHRSETVIVANTKIPAGELNKRLDAKNMMIGSGYGDYKKTQIRIASFPCHSVKDMQSLTATLLTEDQLIA